MVLGRTRDLTLPRMRTRTEHQVRSKLAHGASFVERLLKRHALRHAGELPPDWEQRVKRNQIQGNGHSLPDLVSYDYDGVQVLAVWSYVESDVLHILIRRSKIPSARRPRSSPWPFVRHLMPWGSQIAGA